MFWQAEPGNWTTHSIRKSHMKQADQQGSEEGAPFFSGPARRLVAVRPSAGVAEREGVEGVSPSRKEKLQITGGNLQLL